MRHIKNALKIASFNIVLFIALIFIIEAFVRIIFPDLIICGVKGSYLQQNKYGTSYGFKPNINGYIFEKKFLTDNSGFRINDLAMSIANPKLKILVLGDSISLGLGVEAQDAFPYILQKDITDCQVINTSVPGYGMDDYYNILTDLSKKIDFDGIIVSVCLDDFSATVQGYIKNFFDVGNRREKLIRNPFLRFLVRFNNSIFDFNSFLREHSKTYMLLRDRVMDASKVIFEAQDSIYSMPQIDIRIQSSMQKLVNLASRDNKWIIFVVIPFEYQLRDNINDQVLKLQRIINEVATKAFFPVIDLYPYFKKSLEYSYMHSSLLYCDAMHFSKKGNQIAAKVIYLELSRRGLLKN